MKEMKQIINFMLMQLTIYWFAKANDDLEYCQKVQKQIEEIQRLVDALPDSRSAPSPLPDLP